MLRNMNSYKYEPLDRTKSQIRIFTLLPSEDRSNPLKGRLQVVDFDSTPPYEALSYVWGKDPPRNHFIDIDGSFCYISAHLANVLKHVRRSDAERNLWIDAVCINQDEDAKDESACQVKMMGDIYRRCDTDLAWLEDPLEPKEGKASGEERTSYPTAALGQGLKFIKRSITNGITVSQLFEPSAQSNIRASLEAVFGSRLWSRVWIVQELACAKRVVLLGGGQSLEWDTLSRFLDVVPNFDIQHWPWARVRRGITEDRAKLFGTENKLKWDTMGDFLDAGPSFGVRYWSQGRIKIEGDLEKNPLSSCRNQGATGAHEQRVGEVFPL